MSTLTLKFDDDYSYDGMRKCTFGTNKGKWILRIDGNEFVAPTKEELGDQLMAFVRKAVKLSSVGLVRVGNNVNVIVKDHQGTHRHPCELSGQGVQEVRHGGSGNESLDEAMHSSVYHMAQQEWEPGGSPFPEYLTVAQAKEFRSWVKWQLSYREHIVAGCTPSEAHAKALGYSYA